MSEVKGNCPHCERNCSLSNPGCGRGRRYAAELTGGTPENTAETGTAGKHSGEHMHGEGRHHDHHGHGKGNGGSPKD